MGALSMLPLRLQQWGSAGQGGIPGSPGRASSEWLRGLSQVFLRYSSKVLHIHSARTCEDTELDPQRARGRAFVSDQAPRCTRTVVYFGCGQGEGEGVLSAVGTECR